MSGVEIAEETRKRFIISDRASDDDFTIRLPNSIAVEDWDDSIYIFGNLITERVSIPKRFIPALIEVLQRLMENG